MNSPAELRRLLCEQWCAEAEVSEDQGGLRISLPLLESDGDAVSVWVQPQVGGWRLRDHGTTLMRLSYETEIDSLLDGTRARVLDRIVSEQGVQFVDGELLLDVQEGELGAGLMHIGQAMTRLCDIRLWNRSRVASTFYDDLERELSKVIPPQRLQRNYIVPGLPGGSDYPIDFAVPDAARPLYIFGVPNTDKARLATIVLMYLQQHGARFDSLIVPADIDEIQRADRHRLMNAANDMVVSISATEAIERKVKQRLGG